MDDFLKEIISDIPWMEKNGLNCFPLYSLAVNEGHTHCVPYKF